MAKRVLAGRTDILARHGHAYQPRKPEEKGGKEAEEQSHRFKLKSGNTRKGETFAGLSGLITPGTESI